MAAEPGAPHPPGRAGAAADALVDAVVDQHAGLRTLLQAAARAPEEDRDAACATALRHLAVHVVAEAVALDEVRGSPRTRQEAGALTAAVERLDDLGTGGPTYPVRLGLVAAEVARHVRVGELEVLPRFVATRDEQEVHRAVEVLRDAEGLVADRAPDALVPPGAGFAHQLRAARQALLAGLPGRPPSAA